jgi:hypothetical protein
MLMVVDQADEELHFLARTGAMVPVNAVDRGMPKISSLGAGLPAHTTDEFMN